jgi:hypothetical protein
MRLLGLISLLMISLNFSQAFAARVLVVTDMDDTIKKSNSVGKLGKIYHFLQGKVYSQTRDIMLELERDHSAKGDVVEFHYVSAAPDFLVAQERWLLKHNFPLGPTYLKKLNSPETFTFKYETIEAIIAKERRQNPGEELIIYFFGDNSQHDAGVYAKINTDLGLNAKIYIRDVAAEATAFSTSWPISKLPGVTYFFSESELIDDAALSFMSVKLKSNIKSALVKGDLIPEYTLKSLYRRIKGLEECSLFAFNCKKAAKEKALAYWNSYHRAQGSNYKLMAFLLSE